MAQAGLGSRRACEAIIEAGRVRVNGRLATLGDKADPNKDKIEVDGRLLKIDREDLVYIALNKPKGVLSSLNDEMGEGRRTVRDLIDLPGHLYPVGRLDKQSEGLMLMTNDGDLAHRLTHPRYGHTKVYHVVVDGWLADDAVAQWEKGMPLDDRMTMRAKVEVVRRQKTFTQLRITLREGRKRQIRRLANMLGHPVRELVREELGPLKLGRLKTGQWRHLYPDEVAALHRAVKSKQAARSKGRRRGGPGKGQGGPGNNRGKRRFSGGGRSGKSDRSGQRGGRSGKDGRSGSGKQRKN